MKYLVYLITLLFSTAVAQNPTILQGNYVSNVFGQANFVLNPNAQTSTTNVTVSNATVTRSTTTPLVATTEFNVEVTSANGTITWATRSFDAGMKNQNCEARFSYRGFQATSKAQIKQGANVVAELTLTPSATDPRIASINFPCGDLSAATTFVITDSATLSGTNEIGGIYVGLATNQANVAQAESVLNATQSVAQNISGVLTDIIYNTVNIDRYGSYNSSTGVYTVRKSGTYLINAEVTMVAGTITVGNYIELKTFINTTQACRSYQIAPYTGTYAIQRQIGCQIEANAGDTIKIAVQFQFSARDTIAQQGYTDLQIARLPSSSELVVTPETQNVWGGVKYNGSNDFSGTATTFSPVSDSNFSTETLLGHAKAAGSACGLNTTDYGFCLENVPPGTYELVNNNSAGTVPTNPNDTCTYRIAVSDGTNTQYAGESFIRIPAGTSGNYYPIGNGVIKLDSFTRNLSVRLEYRLHSATGLCLVRSNSNTSNSTTKPSITFKPLDNASNSALYVQGPVKAAETGAAIPAGYVGEVNQSTLSVISTSTSGWQVIKSISLTPGVWLCSAGVNFTKGSATYSSVNLAVSFHWNGTTNPGTGVSYDTNVGRLIVPVANVPNTFGLGINPAVIRVDGSNIYTPWGSGSGSTLYIWFYAGIFTGTINTGSSHTCTRLN